MDVLVSTTDECERGSVVFHFAVMLAAALLRMWTVWCASEESGTMVGGCFNAQRVQAGYARMTSSSTRHPAKCLSRRRFIASAVTGWATGPVFGAR